MGNEPENPSFLGGEGGMRGITDEGGVCFTLDDEDLRASRQPPHPSGYTAHLLPRGEKGKGF